MNACRALTLCAPTQTDLSLCATAAPWPDHGRYSGLEPQFHVGAHGRYVFLSTQVGAHAALLAFEPQHGTLFTYVSLCALETGAALACLMTAEPHTTVYVYQPRNRCAVRVTLGESVPTVQSAQYVSMGSHAVALEDGHVLSESYVLDNSLLVLCKKPPYYS